MSAGLDFHPLVQKDFNGIMEYYLREAGPETADRFESEFRGALELIKFQPTHYPFYQKQRLYRRLRLPTFPHLIIYRIRAQGIRVMILKHVKRSPRFGMKR